jgi:alkanesulfonate monooxygenase SsuD/methylene tetrahydromethanopterin reductase-like flavin-dependent oxidoreductase (luciferase family)
MKVNLGLGAHNSRDWQRFSAGRFGEQPAVPDHEIIEGVLQLGDLAEPLGFDGIWAPEHSGTPYGMTPNPLQLLTVGNKPITEAGEEVRKVNTFRADVGLPPCQPKNVLFTYCTPTMAAAREAQQFIDAANSDVSLHYGFGNPANFEGVKGYESYAKRESYATAVSNPPEKRKSPGYDESNLLIGTPEVIIERIEASQKACSFSEVTIIPNFGTTSLPQAQASVRLFAQEVLPVVHKMDAPLHAAVLPEGPRVGNK